MKIRKPLAIKVFGSPVVRQQLQELATGLFLRQTRSLTGAQGALVQFVGIDKEQNFWLGIRADVSISQFSGDSFFASLHFLRKDKPFSILLNGMAELVAAKEGDLPVSHCLPNVSSITITGKRCFIKLKADNAYYIPLKANSLTLNQFFSLHLCAHPAMYHLLLMVNKKWRILTNDLTAKSKWLISFPVAYFKAP